MNFLQNLIDRLSSKFTKNTPHDEKLPKTFTIMRAIKEGRRYSRVEGKWYFDAPKGE